MKQGVLFGDMSEADHTIKSIGDRLFLKFSKDNPHRVSLYHHDTLIKTVDLSDRVAKRLLVVEAVEMGATKARLAEALGISRQSIHNYTETKKYFGIEGLIHNYSTSTSKSRRRQRKNHASRRGTGNKARQLEKFARKKSRKFRYKQHCPLGKQSHR